MRTLRDLALEHNKAIFQKQADCVFIDPSDTVYNIKGFSIDTNVWVDPQTEQLVSKNQVSITINRSELPLDNQPEVIHEEDEIPWRVRFPDDLGVEHTYKVFNILPERTLGMLTCLLELYE